MATVFFVQVFSSFSFEFYGWHWLDTEIFGMYTSPSPHYCSTDRCVHFALGNVLMNLQTACICHNMLSSCSYKRIFYALAHYDMNEPNIIFLSWSPLLANSLASRVACLKSLRLIAYPIQKAFHFPRLYCICMQAMMCLGKIDCPSSPKSSRSNFLFWRRGGAIVHVYWHIKIDANSIS